MTRQNDCPQNVTVVKMTVGKITWKNDCRENDMAKRW